MIDWEKLEQCAKQVCNPRQLSKNSYAATVGAAIVTDRGQHLYRRLYRHPLLDGILR